MRLSEIAIYFSMDKTRTLEEQIQSALESWDRHQETRDIVPEYLVFSPADEDKINVKSICELEVRYRKDVQRNHFKLEGRIY
jgi:hypothetical protein